MFGYCFIKVIDYMLVFVMIRVCMFGKYSMKNMVGGLRWILIYTVYLVMCRFPLGFLI